jgi:hypothetical protein
MRRKQLPAYRVIIDAYPPPEPYFDFEYCSLGLMRDRQPSKGDTLIQYGGWYCTFKFIPPNADRLGRKCALEAQRPGFAGMQVERVESTAAAAARSIATSAYATTATLPPVSAGGAVEFGAHISGFGVGALPGVDECVTNVIFVKTSFPHCFSAINNYGYFSPSRTAEKPTHCTIEIPVFFFFLFAFRGHDC